MDKSTENKPLVQPALAEEIKLSDSIYRAPRSVATVALPSRGYFYNNPAIKDGNVQITPLSARDMKLVAGITGKNLDGVIDTLLSRCLVTPMKVEDLLATDRYFLLIMLRANSFGSGVKITVKCPRETCGKVSNLTLDLIQDYDLVNIKEGLKEPFEFTLPMSGLKVTYHLPRGRDVVRIEQASLEAEKAQDKDSVEDAALTTTVACLIDTIDGNALPDDLAVRIDAVDSFPALDFLQLKRDMDTNNPGITSQTTKVCSHCGGDIEVGSPLHSAEFFYPLS